MTKDEAASGRTSGEPGLTRALHELTAEQVAQISPKLRREIYGPGETIIRQDDPPERFYIVIRGKVEVRHEGRSGRDATVGFRMPGEYFGEIGLLHSKPRSATVSASEEGEVELLALNHDDFLEMIDESRGTEAQVAREMIKRLIELADYQ